MGAPRTIARIVLAAVLPFSLFLAHGAFFSGWEIDDAGISYAYARNLATGNGLVAQPGAEAVEGFTNLLWVAILAGLLPVVESPGLAARGLSYAFVLGAFLTLAVGIRSWFPRTWLPITAVGLSTTALVTGFPAWTLSGLENGLYAFLLALLLVGATMAPDSKLGGTGVGSAWILLVATRPDAAPLVAIPCAVWAWKSYRRAPVAYNVVAAAGLAGLTTLRVLYFGDVLPNTYYAKRAAGAEILSKVSWTTGNGLLFALAGALILLAGNLLVGWLARVAPWPRKRPLQDVGLPALLATLVLCYLVYETLPTDWMPEGRFATSLFLLGPITLLCLVRGSARWFRAAGAGLVILAGGYSAVHTPAFMESPPAPFGSVITLSRELGALADAMGTGRATEVLLPDIGGALWENRFEVVDLAGLTDPHIARSFRRGDRKEFYDYILEKRRPDLVWIHTYWKQAAQLEADPRWARDYEILTEDHIYSLYIRSAAAERHDREKLLAAFRDRRGS